MQNQKNIGLKNNFNSLLSNLLLTQVSTMQTKWWKLPKGRKFISSYCDMNLSNFKLLSDNFYFFIENCVYVNEIRCSTKMFKWVFFKHVHSYQVSKYCNRKQVKFWLFSSISQVCLLCWSQSELDFRLRLISSSEQLTIKTATLVIITENQAQQRKSKWNNQTELFAEATWWRRCCGGEEGASC